MHRRDGLRVFPAVVFHLHEAIQPKTNAYACSFAVRGCILRVLIVRLHVGGIQARARVQRRCIYRVVGRGAL